ncbi:PhoX family phosphatase [Lentzea sp. NPDC034063]|uniref:PhoX family protein n=1 Tax=unclassified Lentzea TaxID=2643253 RepID=UPI0033E67C85
MSSPIGRGRRMLPLVAVGHPLGRQAVTCKFRCGDACSHEAPNTSDNPYFGDVVHQVASRRGVLKAGAVVAAAGAFAFSGTAAAAPRGTRPGADPAGLRFEPVGPNTLDEIVVPQGFRQDIVIRWGDPVLDGAPEFDFAAQTPQAQAMQFGYNNDYCGLVPVPGAWDRWLMVSNHEYTTEPSMFLDWSEKNGATRLQAEIGWAAHGLSVVQVELDRTTGGLVVSRDRKRYNRRITLTTPFEVRGPAAGSKYLRTNADPSGRRVLGTQNNCSGGMTPWGTILSGEEALQLCFANADQITDETTRTRLARYGFAPGPTTRRWEDHDDRFDLGKEPNEANRFGWIVEIDPLDPSSTPVKHTGLGRIKHEGANVIVAKDGRVAAYMGDDERFEYIYKFVTDGHYLPGDSKRAREHNKRLLDSGTLYVGRFTGNSPAAEIDGTGKLPSDGEFDGTGEWLPLAHNDRSFVPGFTAEEVYVFTRLAADAAGATKMDRPEDVEPSLHNRRVYAALANNNRRGVTPGKEGATEVAPRHNNRHGHVLEIEECRSDNTATTFTWRLMLVCGDPNAPDTYFAGYDKSQVSPISCPDNVTFDSLGNLWITSDGNGFRSNDGLFAVPVEGEHRGHVKQFLTVPAGGEPCGPVVTDDFVLVSVQHPGEIDGSTAANPFSHWPDGGSSQPRPAVAVVWREDRGRICG